MEAKLRHLWGFSVTWWKVMPMHNAWGEREDFVWLLFIDHQSLCCRTHTHTHTYRHRHTHTLKSQPSHSMRCNLSQIKKAGAEEKQESSKLATLSRIKKKRERERNNKTKQKCWRAIFRWQRLLMHKPKERQGEEGAAGLVFVSVMGFNRNTLYVWSYMLSLLFVPIVPALQWKCL